MEVPDIEAYWTILSYKWLMDMTINSSYKRPMVVHWVRVPRSGRTSFWSEEAARKWAKLMGWPRDCESGVY